VRVQSLSLRDVNRQFICEAGAIVMNEEKKKKDDNYLFLFSDLLVLSKPQPKGVYKFKAAINLQYASISPISDGGTYATNRTPWLGLMYLLAALA